MKKIIFAFIFFTLSCNAASATENKPESATESATESMDIIVSDIENAFSMQFATASATENKPESATESK